jgi:hypothetical protein
MPHVVADVEVGQLRVVALCSDAEPERSAWQVAHDRVGPDAHALCALELEGCRERCGGVADYQVVLHERVRDLVEVNAILAELHESLIALAAPVQEDVAADLVARTRRLIVGSLAFECDERRFSYTALGESSRMRSFKSSRQAILVGVAWAAAACGES